MNSLVELLSENSGYGEGLFRDRPTGFVNGFVTDNGNSEFAGMVKVEFIAWEKGKNICEWIPLLRPYAGAEYGSYLVPEVGDLVLVGFMGPDLNSPFVLGSLYPPDAKMQSESFVDKNTMRKLKTKGGIEVALSDEDGKQSVSCMTPGGLNILLCDDANGITITDKNGKNKLDLSSKNGALTFEGEKKITIKCGKNEIVLDGNSGKLSISCDMLEIKAGQKADIDGGQMLGIKGGMTTLEGQQMTTIKGAVVKID